MKLSEKIPNKEAWTRGAYALTKEEGFTAYDSDNACRFCLSGGVQAIGDIPYGPQYNKLEKIVKDYTKENSKYKGKSHSMRGEDFWSIVGFNDSELTTWEDIKEVIRRFDEGD